jgi:hypothetical protein
VSGSELRTYGLGAVVAVLLGMGIGFGLHYFVDGAGGKTAAAAVTPPAKAFACSLALAASAHAAPLAPNPGSIELVLARIPCRRARNGARRAGSPGLWTWLAPHPLARPLGRLALGPLRSLRRSSRRLERRVEPSLFRLARSLWGLG